MACIACYQSREDGANFCRSCGDNLLTGENSKMTVNLLIGLLGAELLVSIAWLVLQKVVVPFAFKSSMGGINWTRVDAFYKVFGWFTDIALIVVTLVCILLVKSRNARIFLIVYLIFRIVFAVSYRLFKPY